MKKCILAVAAFNLLLVSPVQAEPMKAQSKTVITIEQQVVPGNAMSGNNGANIIVQPQTVSPQIVVEGDATTTGETDSQGNDTSCPCPYSMDEHGQMCGAKSAYSKSNGASPDCFANGKGANPNAPVNQIYIK